MYPGTPWNKAEVIRVKQTGHPSRRLFSMRLRVLDGDHEGKLVEDAFLVDSVFTACHQNELKKAAGGSLPRPGEQLQVQIMVDGSELHVGFKGYK